MRIILTRTGSHYRLPKLMHNRHRPGRKLNKCRTNSITSIIAIFHTSSVGLRYSLVFTCFNFFISIELVTKRNLYICVSICLMFQMIDIGSLLMLISREFDQWSWVEVVGRGCGCGCK